MTRVAIMQPTYLPWCGYFGLMQSVDLFILLDSVQFAKRSWQQRNQIKAPTGPIWLTVPTVTKGRRDQKISDVEIDATDPHARRHVKSIVGNYSKAGCFDEFSPSLISQIEWPESRLADLNIRLIEYCREIFGIGTPLMRSSEMKSSGVRAELLANLCEEVGANEYISPPGSKDYLLESPAFGRAGIPVRYFNFIHPTYRQPFGDFLPNMSVIDLLLNCGDESASIIRSGNQISN